MAKTKIIFIKNILNSAYEKCRDGEKGWGKTLFNRINQLNNFNQPKKKPFIINAFLKKLTPFIKSEISQNLCHNTEKIISFQKTSKSKSDKKQKVKEVIRIYGELYDYINKEIREIVVNPINHIKIKFINKGDLTKQINEKIKFINKSGLTKQINEKNKLVDRVWGKLK